MTLQSSNWSEVTFRNLNLAEIVRFTYYRPCFGQNSAKFGQNLAKFGLNFSPIGIVVVVIDCQMLCESLELIG